MKALLEASQLGGALPADQAWIGQSRRCSSSPTRPMRQPPPRGRSPTCSPIPSKRAKLAYFGLVTSSLSEHLRHADVRRARPDRRLLLARRGLTHDRQRTGLIDRRDFLKAAGVTFLSSLAPAAFADTLAADAVFATAYQRRDGAYGAAILSEAGKILHTVDLPDRGHDITFDPGLAAARSSSRASPAPSAVVFDPGRARRRR